MTESLKVPKYEAAGFWVRAAAILVDTAIIAILSFPVKLPFLVIIVFFTKHMHNNPAAAVLVTLSHFLNVIVSFGISVFYCGYFYQKKGATPGKLLFDLRVMKTPEGTNAGYKEAFMRDVLGKILSTILFFAGYIMVAFRKDKRALHDLIAGTVVLKKVK